MFKDVTFFREFPYALPSFVAGAFCLLVVLMSALCLKEVTDSIEIVFRLSDIHYRPSRRMMKVLAKLSQT